MKPLPALTISLPFYSILVTSISVRTFQFCGDDIFYRITGIQACLIRIVSEVCPPPWVKIEKKKRISSLLFSPVHLSSPQLCKKNDCNISITTGIKPMAKLSFLVDEVPTISFRSVSRKSAVLMSLFSSACTFCSDGILLLEYRTVCYFSLKMDLNSFHGLSHNARLFFST